MRHNSTLLLLLLISFFTISCKDDRDATQSTEKSSPQVSRQKHVAVLSRTLTTTIQSYQAKVKIVADGAAEEASKNRSFMLAYFLDQTMNAPVVTDVAAPYALIGDVDYLLYTDTLDTPFAISGRQPISFAGQKESLWIDSVTSTLQVSSVAGFEQNKIHVYAGVTLGQSWLEEMKTLLGVDLLLRYNGEPLLSTLTNEVPISFVNDTTALVNGSTIYVEPVTVSAGIDVLLFID